MSYYQALCLCNTLSNMSWSKASFFISHSISERLFLNIVILYLEDSAMNISRTKAFAWDHMVCPPLQSVWISHFRNGFSFPSQSLTKAKGGALTFNGCSFLSGKRAAGSNSSTFTRTNNSMTNELSEFAPYSHLSH